MPLPRFDRLPAAQRDHVLSVARKHFAADGIDGASYNRIIAAVGISKTSAYQYFDGRGDLLATVLADADERASAVLGRWQRARDAAAYWSRLDDGARRIIAHMVLHPDDRALLGSRSPVLDTVGSWFDDMVANAIELGLIRADLDPDLLLAATAKVFEAIDGWALQRLGALQRSDDAAVSPPDLDLSDAWRMLANLWGTPNESAPGHHGAGRG